MAERAKFEHYEILTRDDGSPFELGRGAMGITYKAFDTSLQCPVALKVINAGSLDSEIARQRFVSEARAAALLRHRHVASVFHLGIEGDAYYYAMEYIDGETVDALIRREGPLTPRLALQLTLQVTRALNAAQKTHLVHRDIKPSNLMLVHEDDELCVKVIDFGLAKSVHLESTETSPTLAGFVGTPHFASPEQLDEREIDVRSDLYSLGCTLWFMLTGHPPFSGSVAQVIGSQLNSEPPFAELIGVPECVVDVLRKLMAKDPDQRPQTPQQLRGMLEEAIARLPEEEAPGVDAKDAAGALENDAVRERDRPFKQGDLAAGRYEILRDLGEGATGDIFKAHDRETDLPVRLIVLAPALIEDRAAYTRLEREVEQLSQASHPNLLGVHGLESVESETLLTLEWTQGFSLVDLLRARRELEPADALPLIQQAAAGADFASAHDLRRVDFAPHHILIHFPGIADSEAALPLRRQPVSEWPEFLVKLNPLGLARELSLSDTWAGGQTIVSGVTPAAAPGGSLSTSYVQALSSVAYELLGGIPSPGNLPGGSTATGYRFAPLANLSEEGNAVLKRAADPRTDIPDCKTFYEELAGVQRSAPKRSSGHTSVPERSSTAPATAKPPGPSVPTPPVSTPAKEPAFVRDVVKSAPPPRTGVPITAIVLTAAIVLLAGALAIIFVPALTSDVERQPDANLAQSTPSPSPAESPVGPAEEPTAEPTAEATATPAPTPNRQDLLREALRKAEAFEAAGQWAECLDAYLAIARDFPESDIPRVRLELVLENLRTGEHPIDRNEFDRLRERIEAAARLDVVAAMMLLGEHLRKDEPTASFNWFCAAAERGKAAAFTQVGLMYSNGAGVKADLKKAVWWFEEASAREDAAGTTCLAECYLNGKGTERQPAKAAKLLETSVAAGDPRAMNLLGTMYHQGLGVPRNFPEAFRLFTEAYERGHLDALGNLGVLYINGDGVPRDPRKAVNLFEKGAAQGNAYCMFLLARCLENGVGINENKAEALSWYRKAAEAGHPGAVAWCKNNKVEFNANP